MTTIVRRRYLPPREAEGPGSRLAALSLVGWASLGLALALLVLAWGFVLDLGDPRSISLWTILPNLLPGAETAAIVGLVAALEWGVPGARRRVPRLWWGSLLLAAGTALALGLSFVRDEVSRRSDDPVMALFGDPQYSAFALLALVLTGVRMGGWWLVARGLSDAGARLPRLGVVAAVLVGALPALVTLIQGIPMLLEPAPPADVLFEDGSSRALFGPMEVASLVLAAGVGAFTVLAGVRLVAGAVARLAPRSAWIVGAIAGALLVLSHLFTLTVFVSPMRWLDDGSSAAVSWTLAYGPPLLLLVAFALGLGRGRARHAALVPGHRRNESSAS